MAQSADVAACTKSIEEVAKLGLDGSSAIGSRSSDGSEASQPPAKRLRKDEAGEAAVLRGEAGKEAALPVVPAPAPAGDVAMAEGRGASSSATERLAASSALVPVPAPAGDVAMAEGRSASSSATEPSAASSALAPVRYPLVARERECAELDGFLESALGQGGKGGSLYVSGGPGTGKTCSVRLAARAWQERDPEMKVVEVNCMELGQPTLAGLLQRIAHLPVPGVPVRRSGRSGGAGGAPRESSGGFSGRSGAGVPAAAAARLAAVAPRVVLVLDEVDQLVSRQQTASGSGALEAIFSLPQLPGAPSLAIVAIANSVDLLERGALPAARDLCRTLLFQPYSADQLRCIVRARLAAAGPAGEAAEKALGRVAIELRVRQVAKRSGDCRPVVCLCEQALFEEGRAREAAAAASEGAAADEGTAASAAATPAPATPSMAAGASSSSSATPERAARAVVPQLTPAKRSAPGRDPASGDPLAAIQQLPMEQQVLLCALTSSKGEAVRLAELCARYKEMCRKLHQRENLSSKQQVSNAVSALEQRGLLALRSKKGGARGRTAGCQPSAGELVVELAVSCAAVRERVGKASPLLQKCLD